MDPGFKFYDFEEGPIICGTRGVYKLNYDEFSQSSACYNFDYSCSGGCFYFSTTATTGITAGVVLYTDSSLTTLAPNGYYSGFEFGSKPFDIVVDELEGFRIISGGVISDISVCPTSVSLNYSDLDQEEACLGFDSSCVDCTYYLDPGDKLESGVSLYENPDRTILAADGYYAGQPFNIVVDEVEGFLLSGGVISNLVDCNTVITPTPTPTPTSTPISGVTPTPTQTPSVSQTSTPTSTPISGVTPTPTPTTPCIVVEPKVGISLTPCSADSNKLYVSGWETGVTFTVSATTNVVFSGNQVSLGGSVTLSNTTSRSIDITVNNVGSGVESLFIDCVNSTEAVYLYYKLELKPTDPSCSTRTLEIYYLVLKNKKNV